jgi:hypothetical protein
MQDITNEVITWISCCQDIWNNWFSVLEDGEDEFLAVEDALFSSLVLAKIKGRFRLSTDECYKNMRVSYKVDVSDYRTVCSTAKARNIYCKSENMELHREQGFEVRSIDPMGVMLDGIPYAELQLETNNFFLEPVTNLNFMVAV